MSAFHQNHALSRAHLVYSAAPCFAPLTSHPSNSHRTEQNSKHGTIQGLLSSDTSSMSPLITEEPSLFGLSKIESTYQDQESSSTQPTLLPSLSMLRERTLSSISWRQARKIGYPWQSPHLTPQKSDENPPPIRLPSPVKNRLQPPPPRLEDDFGLDENFALTPQPYSAPEQFNYKDTPLRMPQQTEEHTFFFDSQDTEERNHPMGESQEFTPSLGGMLYHHPSSSSSGSSAASANSILGFMERRSLQTASQSSEETDCV